MDESRPLWSIKNNELETTAGAVGAEDEPAKRVITDLLDEQSVLQSVPHVIVLDAVAMCRSEDLHQPDRTTKSVKVPPAPRPRPQDGVSARAVFRAAHRGDVLALDQVGRSAVDASERLRTARELHIKIDDAGVA